MKAIIRYCLLYLALTSNAQAIGLGVVDESNTYSSVGYTIGTGGTLGSVVALDSEWLLTAAHVVDELPAFIIMGDPNTGAEGIYIFIEQVIFHDDYVSGEFHDDLALIKLSAIDPIIPIPGVVDASFATLSNVDLSLGLPATATLTGYGLAAVDGTLDPNDPILRRFGVAATDPFGPPAPSFDPGFPYDCSLAMLVCTFHTTGGAPGDSGGAMWLDYGGGDVMAGIMSFIFDENDLLDPPETPDWSDGYWTVGTSTAYYEDWITGYVPTAKFGGSDSDGDGISNSLDNAPDDFNPDQNDVDGDGTGDVADPCPGDATDTCDPDASASLSVGPDGGTVATGNGDVEMTIPAGALDDDTSISIDGLGEDFEVEFVEGTVWAAFSVEIHPAGTVFNAPVTLVFPWDDANSDGIVDGTGWGFESKLRVAKDGVFITNQCQFEAGCDTVANTFTFEVSSLSEFVLFMPMDVDSDDVPDNFDGVADNCTLVANGPNDTATAGPSQNNTNTGIPDDYGNICDADFNDNGVVDSNDASVLFGQFGMDSMNPSFRPDVDMNGNGVIDSNDASRLFSTFGQPPGPSGIAPPPSAAAPLTLSGSSVEGSGIESDGSKSKSQGNNRGGRGNGRGDL